METVDILLPAERHSLAIGKAITEMAQSNDTKNWTESGVLWGKIVTHAQAITELEHAMRQVLFKKVRDKQAEGGET